MNVVHAGKTYKRVASPYANADRSAASTKPKPMPKPNVPWN